MDATVRKSEMNENEMLQTSVSGRVQSALTSVLARVPYGSRLYGTNTPESDYDYKVLYLPKFDDVLLGRSFSNFKARFNPDGSVLLGDGPMPDNGYEMEFVALQTFMRDFLFGQTYAVEMAFAMVHGFGEHGGDVKAFNKTLELVKTLVNDWQSDNVSGMVGFAMKQTFDYVHRGQRLNEAQLFLTTLEEVGGKVSLVKNCERLDSLFNGRRVLDHVNDVGNSTYPGRFSMKRVVNGKREEDALCFAGRTYVESTPLSEMLANLRRMVKSYGTRSTSAAVHQVDSKSLMHAVRVYQQVLELLGTGTLTFPRPNRDELLGVKSLTTPMEEVVEKLKSLDAQVQTMVEDHPPRLNELQVDFDKFSVLTLFNLYVTERSA